MHIRKLSLSALIGVVVLTPLLNVGAQAAEEVSSEWKRFRSCIDLTSRLDNYLKTTPTWTSRQPTLKAQLLGGSSQVFFSAYDAKNQRLVILKGPKDTQNTALNVTLAKILSTFSLPKTWTNVQTAFFQDRLLILSAQSGSKHYVLIYTLDDNGVKPLKFFELPGALMQAKIFSEKMILLTSKPFTSASAQQLVRKHGEAIEVMPYVTSGLKYGLATGTNTTFAKCQDISYQLDGEAGLSMITAFSLNLNAIEKAPEISYYLGRVEEIGFGQDFLFFGKNLSNQSLSCSDCSHMSSGDQRLLLQRFAIDPKIHQSQSAIFDGKLLEHGSFIITGNTLHLITKQESGNLKQYQLQTFNEKFAYQKTIPLWRTETQMLAAQREGNQIFLRSLEGKVQGIDISSAQSQLLRPFQRQDGKTFFFSNTGGGPVIQLSSEKLELISLQISTPQTLAMLDLKPFTLAADAYRNQNEQLLTLLLRDQHGKLQLRGYHILPTGIITLRYVRTYPSTRPMTLLAFHQSAKLSIAVFSGMIDLFMTQEHQQMKVFKR